MHQLSERAHRPADPGARHRAPVPNRRAQDPRRGALQGQSRPGWHPHKAAIRSGAGPPMPAQRDHHRLLQPPALLSLCHLLTAHARPNATWVRQATADTVSDRRYRHVRRHRLQAQWQRFEREKKSWPRHFIMIDLMSDVSLLNVPPHSTIPKILAALKPEQRYAHPLPPGSGDGYLLAQLARSAGRSIVVLCADPLASQRLSEEIPLFAPELKL